MLMYAMSPLIELIKTQYNDFTNGPYDRIQKLAELIVTQEFLSSF